MTLTRRQALLTAVASGLAASAPLRALAAAAPAGGVADAELAALLDKFQTEILTDSPETATALGLAKGALAPLNSRWSDASAAGRAQTMAAYADRRKRLSAIPRGRLTGRDIVTYDTVLYAQDMGAQGAPFSYGNDGARPYVVSQQDGSVSYLPEFLNSQHMIAEKADADAYLTRLEGFAKVLDQETERVKQDSGAGVIPPEYLLTTALKQLAALRAQTPGETRLVRSLADRAAAKGIAGDYATPATQLVTQKVFPALDRQIAAVQAMAAKAGQEAGVWRLPDGEAFYAWALREGTTTTMSAAEIHQMGLAQGAAIDAQMDALLKSQGLTQGTVGERTTALTKDPRYVYPNTDAGRAELLEALRGHLAAIRPHMAQLSRLGLKADVQVKAVPKEIEAGAGLGYMNFASLDGSRPAIYYVNLMDTGNWPKFTLCSLTMHEAIPGHAWHGAYLSERQAEIPRIYSLLGFNAFTEGWALYAEQLADEVGMYEHDPLGRLGYLQAQRFRASRLVVDTGLHFKRWSREQAIASMASATGRAVGAVTSEVDRYCASPGQACGYKVGHTRIASLREKAKAALGTKFDLRDYDDAVVSTGGVPLDVLTGVIERWIAATKA